MKYTSTKHIQMETVAVILNNIIARQINQTPNVSCPLLFLQLNQHQPIGIKGKMIKIIVVNQHSSFLILFYLFPNFV